MASIKNVKTTHNAFHTSNKIQKKKNQEKVKQRRQNASVRSSPKKYGSARKHGSSLPPVDKKLLESSIKSIEEVTEIVGIDSSQNDIPGFNDLNKTQTMLELSLRNS
jgi:hypothetical protein